MTDLAAANAAPLPRMLHTMIRTKNLDASVTFYTQALGMQELRRINNETGKYTLAFVGYGPEPTHTVIELTYNWGQDQGYDLGTGFGHLAVGVPDIHAACDKVRASAGRVVREPGPVVGGSTIIAFVEDPDGYKIEFIERTA